MQKYNVVCKPHGRKRNEFWRVKQCPIHELMHKEKQKKRCGKKNQGNENRRKVRLAHIPHLHINLLIQFLTYPLLYPRMHPSFFLTLLSNHYRPLFRRCWSWWSQKTQRCSWRCHHQWGDGIGVFLSYRSIMKYHTRIVVASSNSIVRIFHSK